MSLGVISRISFAFWSDFWRKSQKRENQKNLGKKGSYAAAWDALIAARLGCQNGTPSGTPRRSFAMSQWRATPWRSYCS